MKKFIRNIREFLNSKWRGDKRIAPYKQRGRVYEKPSGDQGPNPQAKAVPEAKFSMSVIRGGNDIVEKING